MERCDSSLSLPETKVLGGVEDHICFRKWRKPRPKSIFNHWRHQRETGKKKKGERVS